MFSVRNFLWAVALALALLPAASTAAAVSSTPEPSLGPTPVASVYHNDKYGYSVELPDGWRVATAFMDSYIDVTGGGGAFESGRADQYSVFTNLPEDAERSFVETAEQLSQQPSLTGLEPWLEFFFGETVSVFPTTQTQATLFESFDQGNVWYMVSDPANFVLPSGLSGTRYVAEFASDYGRFVYDRAFFASDIEDCPDCTGLIIETAIAGNSLYPPGALDPPPAAYPKDAFETIVASFRLNTEPPAAPVSLPQTGGPP